MKNILAFTLILSLFACNRSISPNTSSQNFETWLSFSKGACFGQCPVYEITFFPNGSYVYDAKRFHDNIGIFKGETPAELHALAASQRELLLGGNYESYYESQIPDLPGSTYRFNQKEVGFKDSAPEELQKAAEAMHKMIKKLNLEDAVYTTKADYMDKEKIEFSLKEGCTLDRNFQEFWGPLTTSIVPLSTNIGQYEMSLSPYTIGMGRAYGLLTQNTCIQNVKIKK